MWCILWIQNITYFLFLSLWCLNMHVIMMPKKIAVYLWNTRILECWLLNHCFRNNALTNFHIQSTISVKSKPCPIHVELLDTNFMTVKLTGIHCFHFINCGDSSEKLQAEIGWGFMVKVCFEINPITESLLEFPKYTLTEDAFIKLKDHCEKSKTRWLLKYRVSFWKSF